MFYIASSAHKLSVCLTRKNRWFRVNLARPSSPFSFKRKAMLLSLDRKWWDCTQVGKAQIRTKMLDCIFLDHWRHTHACLQNTPRKDSSLIGWKSERRPWTRNSAKAKSAKETEVMVRPARDRCMPREGGRAVSVQQHVNDDMKISDNSS